MSGKRTGEGLGGILKGLGDLVDMLGDLAEKGEGLSRTGEIDLERAGKGVKGFYGFSVKMGLGDQEMKVEPFGNIRRDDSSGESVIHEVREPMVDVFQEQDYTLIVAELPGISAEDVHLEVDDDLLTIQAASGDKKYQKEVLLPRAYSRDRMQVTCNNGILEIKCLN
jgi:HSP20 family protein